MSGKITRVGLDEALEPSLTDWARLAAMTDEDIERAIADDPDWAQFNELDESDRLKGFAVEQLPDSQWHWVMRNPSGNIVARSGRGFAEKIEAILAVDDFVRTLTRAA